MEKHILLYIAAAWLLIMIASCASGRKSTVKGETLTGAARWLKMTDCGDYTVVDIRNPWSADTSELLERYVLVPRGYAGEMPAGGGVRVEVPLRRSVVLTGAYAGAIRELGAVDAIAAVAQGEYLTDHQVRSLWKAGRIADVGSDMSPSVERIVDADADALLMSMYSGSNFDAIDRMGIPIIKMVDYMEPTPQGRAEWIKLIGYLYGAETASENIYRDAMERYEELRRMASKTTGRPVVITDMPVGGSWDFPAGGSYMAQMIRDAGGNYLWAKTRGVGSIKRDVTAVVDQGADIDCWVIRSYGAMDRESVADAVPLSREIRAWRDGNLWVCDTSRRPLYDEATFHPEYLLESLIAVFHPSLSGVENRYFER